MNKYAFLPLGCVKRAKEDAKLSRIALEDCRMQSCSFCLWSPWLAVLSCVWTSSRRGLWTKTAPGGCMNLFSNPFIIIDMVIRALIFRRWVCSVALKTAPIRSLFQAPNRGGCFSLSPWSRPVITHKCQAETKHPQGSFSFCNTKSFLLISNRQIKHILLVSIEDAEP